MNTPAFPKNPLARLSRYLKNREEVARNNGFTGYADEQKEMREALQAICRAAKSLADIAELRALYQGPPCYNKRHRDSAIVVYEQHGSTEVKVTLGQCRAVQKLLAPE